MNARLLSALALLLGSAPLPAHTPPKDNHDRVIVVSVTPADVLVDYRLELAEERETPDGPTLGVASNGAWYPVGPARAHQL